MLIVFTFSAREVIIMKKYKEKEIIYEEALKLLNKKAQKHDIEINQKILKEFHQGLDYLINNLKQKQDVEVIGEYIYSFIHKYVKSDNKSA